MARARDIDAISGISVGNVGAPNSATASNIINTSSLTTSFARPPLISSFRTYLGSRACIQRSLHCLEVLPSISLARSPQFLNSLDMRVMSFASSSFDQ